MNNAVFQGHNYIYIGRENKHLKFFQSVHISIHACIDKVMPADISILLLEKSDVVDEVVRIVQRAFSD